LGQKTTSKRKARKPPAMWRRQGHRTKRVQKDRLRVVGRLYNRSECWGEKSTAERVKAGEKGNLAEGFTEGGTIREIVWKKFLPEGSFSQNKRDGKTDNLYRKLG